MILHSFMTPAQQGDPPRVPSVQQYDTFVEPDVPQQLVVAAAPDEPDVDMHCPRHVVVIHFFSYFVFLKCRVESARWALKRVLQNSLGDLCIVWDAMNNMMML